MEKAGQLAARALLHAGSFVKEGITTNELDLIANDYILSHGGKSACIGYHGYPKFTCISVNEVICHGVPGDRILKNGDIVNIDITAILQGYYGDTSSMFFVGDVDEESIKLCECAEGAREKGIAVLKPGVQTGDIGFAIEKYTNRKGYHVVKELGGHGIGSEFHEDPFIPSFGKKGRGVALPRWSTITVEPMINLTDAPVIEEKINGSSITVFRTSDGKRSAQYEHTVLITDSGAEILTLA